MGMRSSRRLRTAMLFEKHSKTLPRVRRRERGHHVSIAMLDYIRELKISDEPPREGRERVGGAQKVHGGHLKLVSIESLQCLGPRRETADANTRLEVIKGERRPRVVLRRRCSGRGHASPFLLQRTEQRGETPAL